MIDSSLEDSRSQGLLPVDAGGVVSALKFGMIGAGASFPAIGLLAAANAAPIILGATPLLLGALGAVVGYRLGLHER